MIAGLIERRNFSAALPLLESAPMTYQNLTNLGVCYRATGRFEDSLRVLKRAVSLCDNRPEAYNNLGMTTEDVGAFHTAEVWYHIASQQDASFDFQQQIAFNLACCRLRNRDFSRETWQMWEVGRLNRSWFPPIERWNGQSLSGKKFLVVSEGGYGDAILFCRWLPKLVERGAEVTLWTWTPIVPILHNRMKGVKVIGGYPDAAIPLLTFDYCTSIMSLPAMLGTRSIGDIPAPPKPFADASYRDAKRVGICWAAEENGVNRTHRSMSPDDIAPLASACDRWKFQSLTYRAPHTPYWIQPCLEYRDWLETARDVARMSLVITVDTAIAHLAATLGVETWVILPVRSDWKWFLGTDESPFYPTVKVFRNTDPLEWGPVVNEVKTALECRLQK
jgi:hypothetical protein